MPAGILEGKPLLYGPPSGSLVYLPLVIDDRAIGMLTVQSELRGAITPRHLALMEALAPYVAIAVENSLIHDRLEALNRAIRGEKEELEKAAVSITHLANHDPLTGLPNRRLLFELLQKTFAVARRNGTKVAVIYVDLDDFKPINDSLGHLAGDKVLVAVAKRLCALLRASDTVARVGGDEFVAVLASVKGKADISLAARKILDECGQPFKVDSTECRVGFSMGIAVFPDDGDSIESIVGAADEAMYRVKRAYQERLCLRGRPSPSSTLRSLTAAKGRDNLAPSKGNHGIPDTKSPFKRRFSRSQARHQESHDLRGDDRRPRHSHHRVRIRSHGRRQRLLISGNGRSLTSAVTTASRSCTAKIPT